MTVRTAPGQIMEMDPEVAPGLFSGISFQQMEEEAGDYNTITDFVSLHTPIVTLETELECSGTPSAPEEGEESNAVGMTVSKTACTDPLVTSIQPTDILNEATRQIGWGQLESTSATQPEAAPEWYISDKSTSVSSASSVNGENKLKEKLAKLKAEVANQKDQIQRLISARHTLLVVMHNVQSNLSNTKRDFITAVNRTSELELKLAMQDFELMVANSSVETLTKQLSKAKSFINRLNIELTTETSQNKSLMHKILSLEREIREAEDNNLIPF
jgi:hypothetical protein